METRVAETQAVRAVERDALYRLPVVWLAIALFAASIAGCIVTIMLALAQPDGALPGVGDRLLSVPATHAEESR